jgi:hypothetical protein
MLAVVRLAAQWAERRAALPSDFGETRLRLKVRDEDQAIRAAALLAPLLAGRNGSEVTFVCTGHAGPQSDELVRRLLDRLDREGIWGELELVSVTPPEVGEAAESAEALAESVPLAQAWDDALAELPPDWTDVYAEVELTSSDHLAPAALRLSPLNPARDGKRFAFRFRCSRSFGYGAPAPLVRRCLERLDEAGIPGRVRIVRALSDTKPVQTQGPVWYAGGRVE